MQCAGAGYITVIVLGVISSCVDEMGCDALGKVELVVIPVAKAASLGILVSKMTIVWLKLSVLGFFLPL